MDEQKNKDRIMQVATDLFQEKGPKFTMDELASALKMSKKTLYVYFTDKEDFSTMRLITFLTALPMPNQKSLPTKRLNSRRESSKRCRCCQVSTDILISGSCIC